MQLHVTDYLSEVFNFIAKREELRTSPYFDAASPAKATIGYGINLEVSDYLLIVLQATGLLDGKTNAQIATMQQMFVDAIDSTPKGSQYDSILRTNLDAVAQQYGLASFSVNDAQATAVFYVILFGATIGGKDIKGKQEKLDTILGSSLSHDSKEYVAIMSLFYNAESLVGAGSKLSNAIKAGNRAEAWYEIRYNSNKGSLGASPPSDARGLANRRYKESDLFGLYSDPMQLTDEQKLGEAKGVYRMFTGHRDQIFQYEGLYSPANVDAGSTAIEAQLNPARDAIFHFLETNPNTDIANAYSKWIGSLPNFHSTDLYLDPTKVIKGARLELSSAMMAYASPPPHSS